MHTKLKSLIRVTGWVFLSLSLLLPIGGVTAQHGPTSDHLVGTAAYGNIELVSVEEVTQTPGLVADVAVNPAGTYAFLANWGEPDCAGPETGGQNTPDAGAWVIDITNLSNPVTVGFIPSHQDTRPGEGMQVITVSTAHFSGDMLVMNNEQCGKNGKGGVSFWNVTDPTKPFKLSEHFGDRGGVSRGDANDIHSAFAWDAGDNAYVVMVDNFETTDVDILDITNPKRPRLIREYNLNTYIAGGVDQPEIGLTQSFLHDVVVKEIDGHFYMLLSYWDGGYVILNMDNPASAVYVDDSEFTNPDPELFAQTGMTAIPEGNAHQAEWTMDNQFIIGSDEDFSPFGASFEIVAGFPNAGFYPAGEFGWSAPIANLSDGALNGPTVYGGYGCDDDAIPTPAAVGATEEAILVLQRGPVGDPTHPHGACFFSDKVFNAQAAGWGGVIIANHHTGAGFGTAPDAFLCGGQGSHFGQINIPAVCIGHQTFHLLFNTTPNYSYTSGVEPAFGAAGADVNVTTAFNGWGYIHLFDAATLDELDTFAIPEAMDETKASGFGTLSNHEVATDPQDAKFAYLSYYGGGLRSLEISNSVSTCSAQGDTAPCLVEVGGYLDPNGNDFWGVEAFVRNGETIILGSDRDSGLWIFRRTGP